MSTKTNDSNKSGFDKIANELRNTLHDQLKALFSSFIEYTDAALFELANEAGSNAEQKQCFELLQGVRVDKQNLNSGLLKAFDSYLKPISDIPLEEQSDFEEDDEDDGELSLVSQDTMEEMVLINTINGKAVEKFNESIGKLGLRVEYLGRHTSVIFQKDALIPMNFCKAFKETITILDITTSDKLILYKLFDNEVTGKLNKVYDSANRLLIDAGILPKVKLHQSDKAEKKSSKSSANYDIEDNETDEDINEAVEQENNGGSYGGTGGGNQNRNTASNVSAAPGNGSGGGQGNAQSENSGYFTTEENAGGPQTKEQNNNASLSQSMGEQEASAETSPVSSGKSIGGYPVERASEIVSDFIGNNNVSEGSYEGGTQYYGHSDVLTALSKMQSATHQQVQKESPVVQKIDATEIKQALLSTIASEQGGAITKQVNQSIEKIIDFIKLIFDAIIDDESITDTIKALLLTLQIPVIKASMIDQGFFVEDDHPARKLLDRLAEVGVGITSNKDVLYISINKVIYTLLDEYSQDINAFVSALEGIEKIISDRSGEAKEKEKESQLKAQKVHARKVVLWTLRKSTFGKKLPVPLHKLLLKLWPTIMFNHYINKGKENDEWINLVTTLHELIENIQVPTNNDEFKELKANHMPLSVRVERQLNKYRKVKEHKKEAIAALKNTFNDLLDSYTPIDDVEPLLPENEDALTASEEEIIHALDGVKDEVLIDESNKESEVDPDEPVNQRDKLKQLPSEVRPGVWFQLTADNDRVRRLKLSIILIEEALLVFVDHNGDQVAERIADDFAEELKMGKASIIMGHSVFDSAMSTVFETIT